MKTKTFTGVEHILQTLGQCKSALKILYSYRDVDFPIANLLDEISREDMDLLESYGVIEIDGTGYVSLSDDYETFFEHILDNTPVGSGLVKDSLDKLNKNLEIYVTLDNDSDIKKYSKRIRKHLSNILSRTQNQIISISNEVDIEYRSERNLETKLQMLDHFYVTINELQTAIGATNTLLNDKENLFSKIVGDMLFEIRQHFSAVMKEILKNLNTLMAYINRVQKDIETLKKTRKIADLIFRNQLESMTNIKDVIEKLMEIPLGFGPKMAVCTYVPLNFLINTDEGQILIEKTRESIQISSKGKVVAASAVVDKANIEKDGYLFNIDGVFKKFKDTKNIDLYDFLMDYKYPEEVESQYDSKIRYYYQVIQKYTSSLLITEEWKNRIGFASPVIYNLPNK